jgi:hypothetical protein
MPYSSDESELLSDHFAKQIVNLRVTGNRRLPAIHRIPVDVVPGTMTIQMAPCFGQFPD